MHIFGVFIFNDDILSSLSLKCSTIFACIRTYSEFLWAFFLHLNILFLIASSHFIHEHILLSTMGKNFFLFLALLLFPLHFVRACVCACMCVACVFLSFFLVSFMLEGVHKCLMIHNFTFIFKSKSQKKLIRCPVWWWSDQQYRDSYFLLEEPNIEDGRSYSEAFRCYWEASSNLSGGCNTDCWFLQCCPVELSVLWYWVCPIHVLSRIVTTSHM